MSIGDSGRIVIEIDPSLKRELHASLCHDGQTLKKWFIHRAEEYLIQKSKFSESKKEKSHFEIQGFKGKNDGGGRKE